MNITKVEKLELDACQGAPLSFVEAPVRDLSTPRGRLLFVRDVVLATPDNQLAMERLFDWHKNDCGCAIFHYRRAIDAKHLPSWKEFGISEAEYDFVFDMDLDYPIPTGAPAKAEFLRRIDEVLATPHPHRSHTRNMEQ